MASVGGAKRPGGGDPDLQPGVSKKARHKYVVDEAEESDGGGGNAASGGEEDGASVDSYEDDGFVDKTDGAAEVGGARNAGAESDGSEGSDDRESSSDDSDDSDSDSDGGDEAGSGAEAGKRGKKRRLRAKRETVLDDEDLALVKENAAGEFLTSEDGPRLPGDEDILKSFEAAEVRSPPRWRFSSVAFPHRPSHPLHRESAARLPLVRRPSATPLEGASKKRRSSTRRAWTTSSSGKAPECHAPHASESKPSRAPCRRRK